MKKLKTIDIPDLPPYYKVQSSEDWNNSTCETFVDIINSIEELHNSTIIKFDTFQLPMYDERVHNVHFFENKVYTTFIAIGDSLNVTLKHENNI